MTTNGQAPFVTLFMYFQPDYEYAKEAALIDEEILRQRIQGLRTKPMYMLHRLSRTDFSALSSHARKARLSLFALNEQTQEIMAPDPFYEERQVSWSNHSN